MHHGDTHEGEAAFRSRDSRFDEIYERYRRVVYARCLRMLGQHQAAEDASQEVFCRVAKHVGKAPTPENALPWIYRITSNYCLNELRDVKRRPREEPVSTELPDAKQENSLANRDLARRIIVRAPAHLRAAAWLYHVDGMTHDDIGEALGVCRRTVINYIADFEARALRFVEAQR